MSRKRKQGERPPSPRLNDTVNQLSDGVFEDIAAILGAGKRKRVFLELILWHRGKQPYNPDAEKEAFKPYGLNSIRDVALRELGKVLDNLRLELPKTLTLIAADLASTPRTVLFEALEQIGIAKAHAIKRCYLERLLKLVALEAEILTLVKVDEGRALELKRIDAEMKQAKANLQLAKDIAYHRVEYLEKVNATRSKTGKLDHQIISAYLNSDFAQLDVKDFPLLLFSEKSLLDEVFNGLSGKVEEAYRIAALVCELDQKSFFLSPLSRAKLLVRLNDYCIALGDRLNGERLIGRFAALDPEKPENRDIYLIRFLVVLLDWATESEEYASFGTVLEMFERNQEYVIASQIGGNRSRILISMMAIYLGRHDGGKAKELFDHLYRDKEQKPPLYYRICFLICHLMILYDLKEVVDLRLNAKNYREFMLEKGEISVPAIDFLAFLRKNAKRFAAPKLKTKEAIAYNAEVDAMISLLQLYQRQDTVANRLFYGPCIHWLRAKHI